MVFRARIYKEESSTLEISTLSLTLSRGRVSTGPHMRSDRCTGTLQSRTLCSFIDSSPEWPKGTVYYRCVRILKELVRFLGV